MVGCLARPLVQQSGRSSEAGLGLLCGSGTTMLKQLAQAMFGTRYRAADASAPPGKRLRTLLLDFFESNEVSARRVHQACQTAAAAGVEECEGLAAAGSHGRHPSHLVRDLLRMGMRRHQWPQLYWIRAPFLDPKTKEEVWWRLPLLLPHEILSAIVTKGTTIEVLSSLENMAESSRRHVLAHRLSLGDPCLVGIGLWLDGVPFAGHGRSESLEVLTMCLPGLAEKTRDLRIPLAAYPKQFQIGCKTWDTIFSVLVWSMEALLAGRWPLARHSDEAFGPEDSIRKKKAGLQLGCRAILCEVRADWAALKQVFRVPQHNEREGMCMRCGCTPEEVRLVDSTAPWRARPLTHWEVLERMAKRPQGISPLLSAPTVRVSCFVLDWMHISDLGVAADFAGGCFSLLVEVGPGSAKAECRALFLELQAWYEQKGIENRLPALELNHFRRPNSTPKLKSKAAPCRALIPWLPEALQGRLGASAIHNTVKSAAQALSACYSEVTSESCDPAHLHAAGRRFAILLVALEAQLPQHFGVKPKLHWWLHLVEDCESSPAAQWFYRDESVGGLLARSAARRGGPNNPAVVGASVLRRFQARHPCPLLV